MGKIKKYIPRVILIDIILYTFLLVMLFLILSLFNLMFREWIYIVSAIIIIPMTCFFGVFAYTPEHVVEKNGEKFVAYVKGFKRTYVDYYDYKNIFVVGNQKRIEEYYGKGGFDPIKNKYGYEYNVESITYYDKNGTIISANE